MYKSVERHQGVGDILFRILRLNLIFNLLLNHFKFGLQSIKVLISLSIILLNIRNNCIHSLNLEIVFKLLLVDVIDIAQWVLTTAKTVSCSVIHPTSQLLQSLDRD